MMSHDEKRHSNIYTPGWIRNVSQYVQMIVKKSLYASGSPPRDKNS
jgi:hypothetical protein